ncbi:MAG: MoxR family ATPase [Spirochaetes bacterium]|nr:MoxR family ATPase [Spirochaetota bacterium]
MSRGIVQELKSIAHSYESIKTEIGKVIVGQEESVTFLCAALLSDGHLLLEGVPGLGKTLLVQSFARASGLSFSRIQFTPDLLPQDITGSEIIDESRGKREFRFVKGPVFANMLLADEINRTPPKTQAALLEAMQERQVTSYGTTHPLPAPFLVMATQNPIEHEGTYPLPEAQLDRFMFHLKLGYPSLDEETTIAQTNAFAKIDTVKPVIHEREIRRMQAVIREVPVGKAAVEYAVRIVRASRPDTDAAAKIKSYIAYGAGPRASQYLILAAKAYAAIHGNDVVNKKEIDAVLPSVLRHRVIFNFQGLAEGYTFQDVLAWIRA